ncbi:MAG: CBS domain-containing protein [Nanoarchaeota archaeon]
MEPKIHKDVIKCESITTIKDVAKLIRDNKVRHIYVEENGKLVGVVGGIDINNKVVAEGKDPKVIKAKDIMNNVEFVTKDQKIEYAYAIMRNFNTFTCPVVDDNKKLIGYYKFAEICEAINEKIK